MAFGAFQPDAFQNNAFQMDDTVVPVVDRGAGGGGGRKRELDWRTYGHPIIGLRKRKPDEPEEELVEELAEALETAIPVPIAVPPEPIIVGPDVSDVIRGIEALRQAEQAVQEAAAIQFRLEDEADMQAISDLLEDEKRQVMQAFSEFMALLKRML